MSTSSARSAGRGLGVMLLVGIFVACAPDLKTDPPTGSGGVGECPSEADTPEMVAVPSPGGTTYCIDSTEVTNAQYTAWLKTSPDASLQNTECKWNTIFANGNVGSPNVPVVNVDWCDAYAFCQAKGKRLCGRIGGGSNDYTSLKDPTRSEWFNVCSKGGALLFPYGNVYEPMACNGVDRDPNADELADVGSIASCAGGYPGVFDMSGNAWEWENSCDPNSAATPEKQLCRRRGGSINNDAGSVECKTAVSLSRDETHSNVGFRCCANL